MAWNVPVYEQYRDERARPFHELVARVPLPSARSVVDLGCGTGELTASLCERFPDATVLGVDSSAEMLAAARPRAIAGRLVFAPGDVARFAPAAPVDLLISNATLHWLPNHETLIPRLAATVGAGGVMAVQMPGNHAAPSHTLLRATADEGPWAERLWGVLSEAPVHPLAFYIEVLGGLGFTVDAWETTYCHILDGEDAVLRWTRGTALRPVLAALDAEAAEAFTAAYAERLRAAYPAGPRGTIFPFRRVFFVARRDR
jgi:trans-aconitate 2-methyltransferase